jgi:uncharacterized membrane protein HdeD (DUF308 family)
MAYDTGETLTRNWAWVLVRGIAAVVFGLLTLSQPAITLAVLIAFFGAFVLVDGVFTIVSAVANRRTEPRWVALLVSGILSVVIAGLTFLMPGVTAIALLYLIAAWACVVGIAEIATAIRLRKVITGEWALILAGVLSVVFGLFLFVFPGAGALAVAVWIGAYAVVAGILISVLAFRLRNWGKSHGATMAARPA